MRETDTEDTWSQRVVPGPVRRRFTAKFFVVVLVAMVIAAGVGFFFYTQANDTLDDQVQRDVDATARLQANSLENWVDGLRFQTRTLARSSTFQAESADAVQASLESQEFRPDVRGVHYIAVSNSTITASTVDNMQGVPFDSLDAPWVDRLDEIATRVEDGNTVFVSDTPYRLSLYGENTIAFVSSPPNVDDRLVVVEAGVSNDRLSFEAGGRSGYLTVHDPDTGVEEFVYDGSPRDTVIPSSYEEMRDSGVVDDEVLGSATVDGTDWTVVAHVSKQQAYSLRNQVAASLGALVLVPLVVIGGAVAVIGRRTGRTLGRLTSQAERVQEGELDESFHSTRDDEFGRLTEAFDDMRAGLKDRIEAAEKARKEAEVSRAEAMELNNYLQEKADEYATITQRCAAGDLTQRMEADGENDSMDRIATEFNDMVEELEKTTGQLKTFADQVETAGGEVKQSADTVRTAAEQVADSVQQISDDGHDQRDRLHSVSETMDDVAADLEAFAAEHDEVDFEESLDRIEAVAAALGEAAESSEEMLAESQNVAGAAEEQAAELTEVSERAHDLQRYARPLRDVLERFDTEAEHEFVFSGGPTGIEPSRGEAGSDGDR